MKVGLAGPIGTEDIRHMLGGEVASGPAGYLGAPFMASLIEEFLRRGDEVVAFTTSTDLSAPVSLSSGTWPLTVHYAPARPHGYLYRNGAWGKAMDAFRQERIWLEKAMRLARPDVVHAHWSYEFAMAALDSGLPYLVTCHDAPQVVLRYMPNLYRLVRYFMARQVLRRARRLTAVSTYLKEKVQPYAGADIAVIPNPLPATCFDRKSIDGTGAAAFPRIVMVLNGWNSMKNAETALKAFSQIRRAFPAATLEVYGNDYGPGGKATTWAAAHGASDGVTFVGPVPHALLMDSIAGADLLVHPSLEETFGMSIAEAMAMGIPAVGGVDSGAVPWVVGEGGLLVDVRDAGCIAQPVIQLCRDRERLKGLGALAQMQARERFSVMSVVDAYRALYDASA